MKNGVRRPEWRQISKIDRPKEYSFSTTDRAEIAYLEACQIAREIFGLDPKDSIFQFGKILRMPSWLPYVPNL